MGELMGVADVADVAVFALDAPRQVVFTGAVTGFTYGVLAVGLILIYRSTRVINFAQGEMGAFGAGLLAVLVVNYEWNFYLALALVLIVGGLLGAAIELSVVLISDSKVVVASSRGLSVPALCSTSDFNSAVTKSSALTLSVVSCNQTGKSTPLPSRICTRWALSMQPASLPDSISRPQARNSSSRLESLVAAIGFCWAWA